MRILITGGAGYIGSTVSNYLLDRGHKITIIDNLSTGLLSNIPKKAEFFKIDISNINKLNQIFFKKQFDIVFHFAAFINNNESVKNPKKYHQNNFTKGKIFLDYCIKKKIKNFIYSSTAAVYYSSTKRVKETDKLKPTTAYSKSKLKLENYLKKKKKNISCIILRYFNVAGSDTKLRCGFNTKIGSNLILNLCAANLKNKKFLINGNNYKTADGTTIRDYIHVEDLAQIHLLAATFIRKKKTFKILNCGYGTGFSVKEILDRFNFISKNQIKYAIGKERQDDIIVSISNPNKLTKLLKWKPKYEDLSYILKSSLNWYKKSLKLRKL